jgi:hypothetical protein
MTQRTRSAIIFGSILLLIAVVATGVYVTTHSSRSNNASVQPSFKALLPSKTSIDELGGWKKLTPPSGDTAYVYIDTIDSTLINVTQQQLPESFKNNPEVSLAQMAKAYSATTSLKADGTAVYLGTSADGPQSVLFVKNDLLVLIKSEKKIQDSSWISYITSLR